MTSDETRPDREALRERVAESLFQSDVAVGFMAECDRERSWPIYLANADAVLSVVGEDLALHRNMATEDYDDAHAERDALKAENHDLTGQVLYLTWLYDGQVPRLKAENERLREERESLKAELAEAEADHARVHADLFDRNLRTDAALGRAEVALDRVRALCDEAEKDADTYKGACIVTTGNVRAALAGDQP